jgi:sarcosine oxidase/L-pipecolate oxidase
MGLRVEPLDNWTAIQQTFPPGAHVGTFAHHTGYLNRDGGWANASQGVSLLIGKVTDLNGKIIAGKNVAELVQQGQRTTGVRCSDGSTFEAELVVLATGSWTGSAFPDLPIGNTFRATG